MSDNYGALDNSTLMDAAYNRLQHLIVTGLLPIGARIDERKLSESLAVSRTPIRDALGKLRKEGLVEYKPHQGNFVRTFTLKEINDLYVVRENLEALAVQLAAEHIGAAELNELASIIQASERAFANNDLESFSSADRDMHLFFIRLADNLTLTDSLDRIDLLIRLARNLVAKRADVAQHSKEERREIHAYLTAGNATAASDAMRAHIESVRIALIAELRLGALVAS